MDDTEKYLIHARIAADGVVERSDVVGAVFGQTEGLLGDELDLRDLQQSSKVGRIDVEISSENGQSFGELTIATSLDKAETAVLGASLETIERVGPCRATIEVTSIEDVRAAKRREVVDRAKELLATAFDETSISSEELLTDVRNSVEVDNISEYAGLPAGPSVETSDAIIIVEGRADVLQLLKYGIKNAIGVEGTNVPEAVASLTQDRTVTVFVDGDRGGELILRELLQVGEIDYVVFAPAGKSVEDLSRADIHSLLREKVSADQLGDTQNIRETITGLIETGEVDTTPNETNNPPSSQTDSEKTQSTAQVTESATEVKVIPTSSVETDDVDSEKATEVSEPDAETAHIPKDKATTSDETPATLRNHIRAVIDEGTGTARLLSESFDLLTEVDADELVSALKTTDKPGDNPFALVFDGELTQQQLDIAAQRGLDHIVARSTGEFVKEPVGTRVLTAEQLRAAELDVEI